MATIIAFCLLSKMVYGSVCDSGSGQDLHSFEALIGGDSLDAASGGSISP